LLASLVATLPQENPIRARNRSAPKRNGGGWPDRMLNQEKDRWGERGWGERTGDKTWKCTKPVLHRSSLPPIPLRRRFGAMETRISRDKAP
jgi:hypothetical protein